MGGEASKNQRTGPGVDDVISDEDHAAIVDVGTGTDHGFIFFEDYASETDDDHIPGSNDSDTEDYDGD